MDTEKAFKHSAELRKYWRLEKRKQRAQAKAKAGEGNYVEDFKDKVREHSKNEQKP